MLTVPGLKSVVLALDRTLVTTLESVPDLAGALGRQGQVEAGSFRIFVRSFTNYAPDRTLYDCLAIKVK